MIGCNEKQLRKQLQARLKEQSNKISQEWQEWQTN